MSDPTRNQGWYDQNGDRPYPVDDLATRWDDNGVRWPHNLLVDASLRFPLDYGKYVFVTA